MLLDHLAGRNEILRSVGCVEDGSVTRKRIGPHRQQDAQGKCDPEHSPDVEAAFSDSFALLTANYQRLTPTGPEGFLLIDCCKHSLCRSE